MSLEESHDDFRDREIAALKTRLDDLETRLARVLEAEGLQQRFEAIGKTPQPGAELTGED